VAKAGPRLTRSGVVDTEKGGGESFSDIRTSSGMFFDRGEVRYVAKRVESLHWTGRWRVAKW